MSWSHPRWSKNCTFLAVAPFGRLTACLHAGSLKEHKENGNDAWIPDSRPAACKPTGTCNS